MKRDNIFLISPYLFSLACMLSAVMILGFGICFSFFKSSTQGLSLTASLQSADAFGCALILFMMCIVWGAMIRSGYEFFGTMAIGDNSLIFNAPFRRQVVFLYSDLVDVGIDYGFISKTRQFWIYFSCEAISSQYCHKITRLPFNKTYMRIQYRDNVYHSLQKHMTNKLLVNKLDRSHSILRVYSADK